LQKFKIFIFFQNYGVLGFWGTGGQVISDDLGIKLENVKLKDLGQCKKIRVDKDNTTIVDGAGKKSEREARCGQIRKIIYS